MLLVWEIPQSAHIYPFYINLILTLKLSNSLREREKGIIAYGIRAFAPEKKNRKPKTFLSTIKHVENVPYEMIPSSWEKFLLCSRAEFSYFFISCHNTLFKQRKPVIIFVGSLQRLFIFHEKKINVSHPSSILSRLFCFIFMEIYLIYDVELYCQVFKKKNRARL
jgi:hypothetical protein